MSNRLTMPCDVQLRGHNEYVKRSSSSVSVFALVVVSAIAFLALGLLIYDWVRWHWIDHSRTK